MGVAAQGPCFCCKLAALMTVLAIASAGAAEQAMTFADVQRIALASGSAAGAVDARRSSATVSGSAEAEALGIPVDEVIVAKYPGLEQTTVAPPSDDAKKYESAQQFVPLQPEAAAANSRVAFVPYRPIAANSPFVRTKGMGFMLNNKPFWPGGTNWYDAIVHGRFNESFLVYELKQHWQHGVRVVRIFGFTTASASEITCCSGRVPIQPAPYKYNEVALRHFDHFMNACSQVGMRVIIVLTNFVHNNGNTQWYVNNTIGTKSPRELFFTANQPRAAYKHWMMTLANRKNTRNGRIYKQDPAIFAFELCNECGTGNNYEYSKKIYPGTILYNWLVEMSSYLKYDLKVLPMVTSGNEGFRMKGPYDPYASVKWPFYNWANTGLKGEDFNRNLYIKSLDFATVHAYPENFGFANSSFDAINEMFLGDRMRLARFAGKPLLFEEFGIDRDYLFPPTVGRDKGLTSLLSAANAYGYSGALVWQVHSSQRIDADLDFAYYQVGASTLMKQFAWLNSGRAKGAKSPFAYSCARACKDVSPRGQFTCKQQKSWGQCCQSWMQAGSDSARRGYCLATCNCGCGSGAFTSCPTPLAQKSAEVFAAKYAPKGSRKQTG